MNDTIKKAIRVLLTGLERADLLDVSGMVTKAIRNTEDAE
jgi:hypothetical protein